MADDKALSISCEQRTYVPVPAGIRLRAVLLPAWLVAADYAAVLAAVWSVYLFRQDILPRLLPFELPPFDIPGPYMFVIIPFAYIWFMVFDDLYTRRLLFWQQAAKVFKVSVYAMASVLVVMYLSTETRTMSRFFMILTWATSVAYLVAGKSLLKKAMMAMGLWQVPAIIVGADETAGRLIDAFRRDSGLGYKVVGLIDDAADAEKFSGCPLLGPFARAEECMRRFGVKDVLIIASRLPRQQILSLVYRLQPHVDSITVVPDLFGVPVGDMQLDTLFNEKAVLLKIRNNLAHGYNRFIKRCFDIAGALTGLVLCVPLFAALSLLIRFDSPGPVIFAHRRIGKDGRAFQCYKFRTMIADAEKVLGEHLKNDPAARAEWEQNYKLKNDPRITGLGRFLRKSSLDELPQLFNVLKGEMSLVGPRPIVEAEVPKYAGYIRDFYDVRPGLTGLWQVSGRSDVSYDERIQLDSWYVRNWSLWLDITLILRTVGGLLGGRGAY